jgi:hypothetical protein
MNSVEVHVSFGEAFDKLSILDIKLQNIKDNRRLEVQKEYNILQTKLKPFFNRTIDFYYNLLKNINSNIWKIQDDIRLKELDKNIKGDICLEILDENDRRFRVKSKIDNVLSSNIKEQKGYPIKCCLINIDPIYENIKKYNGIIRYFSTSFDKVILPCYRLDMAKVKEIFKFDTNIEILSFNDKDEFKIYFDNEYKKYIIIYVNDMLSKTLQKFNESYFFLP